jgi:hypothetical protein
VRLKANPVMGESDRSIYQAKNVAVLSETLRKNVWEELQFPGGSPE